MNLGLGSSLKTAGNVSTPGIINDGLVSKYNFDTGALDTSGNNNHGTAYTGQALEFDGVADYITIPLTFMNAATAVSISLWFNTTESNSGMIAKYASSSIYAWWINVEGGKLTANINANKSATSDLTSTIDVNDGNWHYATLTWSYSSGLASLYLDGVLIDTDANTNETDLRNGSLNNTIGFQGYISSGTLYEQGAGLHQGLLSNVQIWDKVLTVSDIAYAYANPEKLALDNSGTSLTYSDLKLWYPMQDGHRGQQSFLLDGANTGLGASDTDIVTDLTFTVDSNWSQDGNSFTSDGTSTGRMYKSAATVGKTYKISYDITAYTSGAVRVELGTSDDAGADENSGIGSYSQYFTAKTNTNIYVNQSGLAFVGTFDNLSILPVNDKNHGTSTFHGDELITNGTMEADSNWADRNIGAGESNARSTEQANNGTYSRKIVGTANDSGCTGDSFSVVAGRAYYVECYVYPVSGTCRIQRTAGRVDVSASSTGTGAWEKISGTAIAASSGTESFKIVADGGASTFYVDDVSVKEVGFAKGWTDADVQPIIPQLGFKSYNQLAWFTAADDLVDINADTSLASGSYSFWAISNRTSGKNLIFGHGHEYSGVFAFNWSSNRPILRIGANEYVMWDDTSAQDDGNWHHWVVYMDADDVTDSKLYVDGVLQAVSATANTGSDQAYGEGLNIGSEKASSPSHQFEGCITEFSWWNKELSLAEAQELYNDGEALDALTHSSVANLSGYWRNKGNTTWTDLSGNSNNGTPTSITEQLILPEGNNNRDTQGFLMTRDRVGLNLDGTGYAKGALTTDLTTAATWGLWMNQEILDVNASVLGKGTSGSNNISFYTWTDGYFYFDMRTGSTIYGRFDYSSVISPQTWHYLTVVFDGSLADNATRLKVYVDGVAQTLTFSGTVPTSLLTNDDLQYIGNGYFDYPFKGQLDDVAIYNKALSVTEITRNYKAGKRRHKN